MQPCKSESFRFHRNTVENSSTSSTESSSSRMQQCRKRLKEKFDESQEKEKSGESSSSSKIGERSVLSVLNLNDTKKAFRNGAERLSKTFNTVRTTFGSLSQRFKSTTKRRQILEEGPMTPNTQTPYSFSKQILGRTPTKLYSPFGIESPYNNATTIDKENLPHNHMMQMVKINN